MTCGCHDFIIRMLRTRTRGERNYMQHLIKSKKVAIMCTVRIMQTREYNSCFNKLPSLRRLRKLNFQKKMLCCNVAPFFLRTKQTSIHILIQFNYCCVIIVQPNNWVSERVTTHTLAYLYFSKCLQQNCIYLNLSGDKQFAQLEFAHFPLYLLFFVRIADIIKWIR